MNVFEGRNGSTQSGGATETALDVDSTAQRLNRPVSREQADIWALVLAARGVPHTVRSFGEGRIIFVPPEEIERAEREIRSYEAENRGRRGLVGVGYSPFNNTYTTLWVVLLLTGCLSLALSDGCRSALQELGSADAARIREGEWWRSITALTLHADPHHLLSNMAIGGFLVVWLCNMVGSGPGWALALFSGVVGNLVNAMVVSLPHKAVGASTSVFGIIGVISGIQLIRMRKGGGVGLMHWLAPFAAGIALLGFLGTGGGEATDLGAHFFGFCSGFLMGLMTGIALIRFGYASRRLSRLIGAVALLVPAAAWLLAALRG